MLTNILKVIIIYFAFFSCSLGTEYFSIKFHKLKINSITEGQFNKIGTIRGKAREYPYGFNYYANVKEGNLQELIETFYFENYGDYVGRFSAWARNTVYTSNSKNGCNNSKDKIYHAVVDNGVFHFNCFSVKIVSGINEIWGPNFNSVNYIPMGQRKSTLKKFLKKKQIKIPNQMFRVEHYFYKSGKLTWVFYTLDTELLFKDLTKENINKFISQSKLVHQNFEKDLRYKNNMKISID